MRSIEAVEHTRPKPPARSQQSLDTVAVMAAQYQLQESEDVAIKVLRRVQVSKVYRDSVCAGDALLTIRRR